MTISCRRTLSSAFLYMSIGESPPMQPESFIVAAYFQQLTSIGGPSENNNLSPGFVLDRPSNTRTAEITTQGNETCKLYYSKQH